MLSEILQFTQDNQRYAITSHARPDGDSIGSQLALALALEKLGKDVQIFNADPPPHAYRLLPGIEKLQITAQLQGEFDGLFVLECNDLERPEVGGLDNYFCINIDHHPNTSNFGHLNWVDTSAAAVGEMIFQLIKGLDLQISPEIATNLYVALLTDTGSFHFPSTTYQTFSIATELVGAGADPSQAAQQVYMSEPLSKVRLLCLVLKTLQIHASGKIAWMSMTDEMLEEAEASADETEGIVNHALSVDGVKLVAFFRQEGRRKFRISLRSKDSYDVGAVARSFDGGGHVNAAGLTVEGSLEDVIEQVISRLEKLL